MHGVMPKRSQAYLWRPAQPSTTIGAQARAPTNNAVCGSCSWRPALRPGESTTLQRVDRCAPDLERELGLTVRQFPLKERSACRAMPRRAASLRGAFAPFFGKQTFSREQCLSAGATRQRAVCERV